MLDTMKSVTSREFFLTPSVVKVLHPGQTLVVTDRGRAAFTVTKTGKRQRRSRAELERKAKRVAASAGPKIDIVEVLRRLR
jgi:hypothetical protein